MIKKIVLCMLLFNNANASDLNLFYTKLLNVVPAEWTIVEKNEDVIPYGHYAGDTINKGISILLKGNKDVYVHWKDKLSVTHKEAVAKESVEIWIMPSDYRQSLKRFFIIKRKDPAEFLFSNDDIQVYARISHVLTNKERFNEILSMSSTINWPSSPYNTKLVSWKGWRGEISRILGGVEY